MQIISGARGRITSPFGATNVPGANVPVHKGMDRGHGDGTPDDLAVYAPAAGEVVSVAREGTYGWRIIIDHGGSYTSLLAHLSAWTVREGDQVKQGERIATMGNTGTKYVHLHQELRYRGVPVDPELYLTTTPTEGDDDVSFADQIKHREVDAPASVVLADTLTLAQQTAKKLDALLVALGATDWVKHNGVDAPDDVVDADTLLSAQQTNRRLDALEPVVRAIAAKVGAIA